MRNIKRILGLSLVLLMFAGLGVGVSFTDSGSYGSLGAENDGELTLEEMLKYAIEDEYLARKEYEEIMDKFGEQRPFSNIIKSEEYHIELLKPLFEEYDIEVPKDNSSEYVYIPETIEEAFKIGVEAEIKNIAMYEKFLKEDLNEDVKEVFELLKNASENHLKAFERGVSRRK